MRRRDGTRAILVRATRVVAVLLLWAGPAAAMDVADQLIGKLIVTGVVLTVVLVVGVVAFVLAFARLLGLKGGVLAAIGSVLLGTLVAVGFGIAATLMAFFLPKELLPAIGAAAGIVGGGVGVKVLFKTDIGHGILVYLMATTCVYVLLGAVLVVVF